MKYPKIIIGLLLVILFSACDDRGNNDLFNCVQGEGIRVSQELSLSPFHSLKSRGPSIVFIEQGSPQKVEVDGQQNIIDQIKLNVVDGQWTIEFEECLRDYDKLIFHITMPDITRFEVSGAGSITAENALDVGNFEVEVDGSGSLKLAEVNAEKISAIADDSGNIELAGNAQELTCELMDKATLKAFDLEAQKGNIKIYGTGDAEVNIREEMVVRIIGGGDVHYRGNPIIDVEITGDGELKNAN